MFEDLKKEIGFADEQSSGGDDWFKLKDGSTKVRVMHIGKLFTQWFDASSKKMNICVGKENGDNMPNDVKPSIRYMTWLLEGGQLKIAILPYKIYKAIEDLQASDDWGFKEMPMPYDITLNVEGAGTKEVKYNVIPSPKMTEVSPEILADLAEQTEPSEIVQKMKDKRIKALDGVVAEPKAIEYPKDEVDPEHIPF